jgi:membrane fusion protein, macrolide-specific efflux system
VDAGQEILKLRAQVVYSDGTSGTEWEIVTAPASGTLSSFTALVGQQFAVGEPVGQIAPPAFHVKGSIPPEQLYRLIERPADAQVTINGGPAPFTCTGLSITSPLPGSGTGGTGTGGTGGTTGDTGPTVRCAVPADVTVFSGLTAEIVIAGGIAENVLTVPITAVEGTAGTGNVYFVLPDGTTELRPVTLGLNDGMNVEVIEGLEEGDLILQFIPGAPAGPMGEECQVLPDGGMVCEG